MTQAAAEKGIAKRFAQARRIDGLRFKCECGFPVAFEGQVCGSCMETEVAK